MEDLKENFYQNIKMSGVFLIAVLFALIWFWLYGFYSSHFSSLERCCMLLGPPPAAVVFALFSANFLRKQAFQSSQAFFQAGFPIIPSLFPSSNIFSGGPGVLLLGPSIADQQQFYRLYKCWVFFHKRYHIPFLLLIFEFSP